MYASSPATTNYDSEIESIDSAPASVSPNKQAERFLDSSLRADAARARDELEALRAAFDASQALWRRERETLASTIAALELGATGGGDGSLSATLRGTNGTSL